MEDSTGKRDAFSVGINFFELKFDPLNSTTTDLSVGLFVEQDALLHVFKLCLHDI